MKHLATILHTALILLSSSAAVPLRWTVETSRATPAAFEAYQGETLEFEAALMSHGKPLQAPSNYALYWQTNGMGGVYWSTNCAAGAGATNVMRATWRPEFDAGAKTYNCFIGAPGDIYHAAFQLRLRPSPGATPGALPLPTPVIDFAHVTVLNPPWPTNDLTSAVASNAAAIASHSSQLSQLSQSLAAHTNDTTNNPHRVTAEQTGTYDKSKIDELVANPHDRIANRDGAEIRADLTAVVVNYTDDWVPSGVGATAAVHGDYYTNVTFAADMGAIGEWMCDRMHFDGQHWIGIGVRMMGDYTDRYAVDLKFPNGTPTRRRAVPSVQPALRQKIALVRDIPYVPPPPGNYAAVSNAAMTAHRDATNYTGAAVASLDAALREYPRIVRRGMVYYREDIVDRGGDDITYTLSRFPVVSFRSVEGASSFGINKTASAAVSLEISDGTADFAPLEFGQTYPLPVGSTLYVRAPVGVTNATLYGCKVATDGKVAVGGNLMALVAQDEPKTIPASNCFRELFKGSTGVVDVCELALPATTLKTSCYQAMFSKCFNLRKGPKLLPALASVQGCYYAMFEDCREMVSGPTIMLQDVSSTCCYVMFVDCWHLQSVSMPNQTGKTAGGAAMSNSLRSMIQNTGNVRHISVPSLQTFGSCDIWTYMGPDKPFYPWPTDGTFVCPAALGDNETIARGVSACPVGWTVINK